MWQHYTPLSILLSGFLPPESQPKAGTALWLINQHLLTGCSFDEAIEKTAEQPQAMAAGWFAKLRDEIERDVLARWDMYLAAAARVLAKLQGESNSAAATTAGEIIERHRVAREGFLTLIHHDSLKQYLASIWEQYWPKIALAWESKGITILDGQAWAEAFGLRSLARERLEETFELLVLQETARKTGTVIPDVSAYVSISQAQAMNDSLDTYKKTLAFVRRHKIRTRKPSSQRLEVHAGDFMRAQAEETNAAFEALGDSNLVASFVSGTVRRHQEARKKKAKRAQK